MGTVLPEYFWEPAVEAPFDFKCMEDMFTNPKSLYECDEAAFFTDFKALCKRATKVAKGESVVEDGLLRLSRTRIVRSNATLTLAINHKDYEDEDEEDEEEEEEEEDEDEEEDE
jgi:hypothetical protein